MKTLYLYGAGGVGRELILLINDLNREHDHYNIEGFIDDNKELHGKTIDGLKVLGGMEKIANAKIETYLVMGIAEPKIKQKIVESLQNDNIKWVTLVNPMTYKADNAEIGIGSTICYNNILSIDSKIGKFVYLNFNCIIPHDTTIGDYSSLMNNVILSGNVTVGKRVYIGSNAFVKQGIKIGDDAVIGAGTVVLKDVPSGATVVGNPGRQIK